MEHIKCKECASYTCSLTIYSYLASETPTYKVNEQMIYGSSRLGLWKSDVDLLSYIPEVPEVLVVDRGNKRYEMNDHLSNVHAVVTDRRKRICEEETFSHYEADIQTTYDYYAFGMMMPGRTFSAAIDSIPCVPDTQVVADTLYALDFGSSTESFTSIFGATLSNTGGALQVGKTTCPFRGACENYGAARAISLADMQTYTVSFDLDKGSCTNDISVLFKDASGTAISTTNYGSSGTHSFSFTPAVGVASFEIRMVANEGCQFSLDNLLITHMDTITVPCDTGGMGNNILATGYRFGFNGQMKDDEVYGEGNSYTAEYWQYDPRIGRRWNIDPILRSWESPYIAFFNNPIFFKDPTGETGIGSIEGDEVVIRSNYYFYGDIDKTTADEITAGMQTAWNNVHAADGTVGLGKAEIDGKTYNVRYEITAVVIGKNQGESEEAYTQRVGEFAQNEISNLKNNFVRVEETNASLIARKGWDKSAMSGNTGFWLKRDLYRNGKTASHEHGHGLKLGHTILKTITNFFNIMTPMGATPTPDDRVVTQADIDALGLGTTLSGKKEAVVGEHRSDSIYGKDGSFGVVSGRETGPKNIDDDDE